MGRSMRELNANVMTKLCELEAQTISTLQSLAMIDPIEFAYAWNKRPGYTALIRGEVVHMIKCVPVNVYVHTSTLCTNELPVLYLDRPYFMNSRSHILSEHWEDVSCNAMFPVKYRLKDQWFTLGPALIKSTAPKILKLNINYSDWMYKELNIGTAGIYSPEDIDRQRMAVLFPLEMRAITRSIASTVGGYQSVPSSFKLANLVDKDYLHEAIASYWEKFHSGLQIFGIYSGAIMGMLMIIKILSSLCKGGINCYILSKMFGKCFGILAIICPALANSAIIFGNEEMKNTGNNKATLKGSFQAFQNRGKLSEDQELQLIENNEENAPFTV